MSRAGEEGYEDLCICPYDKAHEIRRGKLQFHLNKCRENHKAGQVYIQCPFNSTHTIPKLEEQFHTEEECSSRTNWHRYAYEVGDANCPVKELVSVNAATVDDGGESWDDFEAQGSVLETIKKEALKKDIFRSLQCESKAKRKEFRNNEKLRHSSLQHSSFEEPLVSTLPPNNAPLRRPTKATSISVTRQDPAEAVAQITKQFRSLDMMAKPSTSGSPETLSMHNNPTSSVPSSSVTPFESAESSRSQSSLSYASVSRPSTAMSSALSSSGQPTRTRPSTALNIAESATKLSQSQNSSGEVFCKIPIPGLGRGSRRKD